MNKVLFFCLILVVISSIYCLPEQRVSDQDLIGRKTTLLRNETSLIFNRTAIALGKRPKLECRDYGEGFCAELPRLIKCDNIAFNRTAKWKCDVVDKHMSIKNSSISCLKDNSNYTSDPNTTVYLDSCYLILALGKSGFTNTYLSSGLLLLSFISSFLIGSKFQ